MQTWVRVRQWTTPGWWLKRGLAAFLLWGAGWIAWNMLRPAAVAGVELLTRRDFESEADRLAVTYKDVQERPEWAVGLPVLWVLSHPAPGRWYYGGAAGLPVSWAGAEPALPDASVDGAPPAYRVLARVLGADPRGVRLSFERQR